MINSTTGSFWRSPLKTILLSGFVAGTLDMLTAITVYVFILHKTTAIKILYSIASGVLGKEAYAGGMKTAMYGLAFHFIIAFSFAITYFLVFPFVPFLRKQKIISGLLYGIFVWMVMNMLVLPAVFTNRPPQTFEGVIIGMSILMCMIGLPISLITHKHYSLKKPGFIM